MKMFLNPFKEFDKLFIDLAGAVDVDGPKTMGNCFVPRSDIVEHEEMAEIVVEVPGVKMEDVSVNVEDGILTISGVRKPRYEQGYLRRESCYGKFERKFSLPETIDPEKIGADYKLGVLTVMMPKKPKAVPKKIGVSVS